MLKRILLAIVPVTMLAASVQADENELVINAASITDAGAELVEINLDVDVDQLTADAGSEEPADAIEACFRRFGYGGRGWGGGWGRHWGGGYGGGYGYWNQCRPFYNYTAYHCVRPLYHCGYAAAPIYNHYWGCY